MSQIPLNPVESSKPASFSSQQVCIEAKSEQQSKLAARKAMKHGCGYMVRAFGANLSGSDCCYMVVFNVRDHEVDGYLKIVEKHASGLFHVAAAECPLPIVVAEVEAANVPVVLIA
ncbi:hypothetical protein U1Q18_022474 [Sarracenia purpurea var. burkii]